jgi:dihydrolipoamide dehydrogenase
MKYLNQENRRKFMSERDYDIAVIGAGPGGYVAAIRASQLGARVALIEKKYLGGVCANIGCIPTKALIHSARMKLLAHNFEKFGIEIGEPDVNFEKVAAHRDRVVSRLRKGVESLLKGNKVEVIKGKAQFTDEHILSVKTDGNEETTIEADKIIVATGSVPARLPIAEPDGKQIIDSSVAVSLKELPESMLIIGAGYIGCEFAAAFAGLGVDVKVVEMLDRILPLMEEDCAREVAKQLKKQGVDLHTGTKVENISKSKSAVTAELSDGERVKADKVLVAIGRRPSAEELNLQAAGLEVQDDGSIDVNAHMQTEVPHIYAIGDVTGGVMLAHVASQEGVVAAAHATGKLSAKMDYRVVPACAFTQPQVASVGLSAEEAEEQYDEVIVKKFPMIALGKAQVEGETGGFVKMIAEAKTGEVLGVHIVSHEASNLLGEASLALKLEATAEELAETIHAHPTMPESLREAAEGVIGLPINWQ